MIIPLLLLLLVGCPLLIHEGLRLADLHGQCTQRWIENAMLVQNSICTSESRHLHGTKMEQVCRQAHDENTVSPEACAFRELWRQGAVYRLWDSVVGSPWMLFGLLGGALFLLFQTWQHRAQRQLQERMYEKTMAIMSSSAHRVPLPPSPPPIQFIMPAQPQLQHQHHDDHAYARLGGPRSVLDL